MGARRTAIYARVSTIDQGVRATSLDDQVERCASRTRERADRVVAIYREVGSGQDLARRPQLSALRAAIQAGEIDVVLIDAIDRLTRDVAHLHFLMVEFGAVGCSLELATEEFALTPIAKLLQAIRGFVAETELLRLRERCIRGKRARAEHGLLPTNHLPYGYRWEDAGKLKAVPDERTAPIVVAVFETAAAGASLGAIARALNAAEIPTSRAGGRGWTASALSRLVHNPVYKGEPYALRTMTVRTRDGRPRSLARPSEQWIRLPTTLLPPLISPDIWTRAATSVASHRKRRGTDRVAAGHFLLAGGIVRCGLCGQAMVARGHQAESRFYRCARSPRGVDACGRLRIDADSLDRRTWQRVVRTAALGGPPPWTRRAAKRFVRLDESGIVTTEEKLAELLISLSQEPPVADKGQRCGEIAQHQERLRELRRRLTRIEVTWTALAHRLSSHLSGDQLCWDERRSWLQRLAIVVSIWPRSTTRLYEVASVVAQDDLMDREANALIE